MSEIRVFDYAKGIWVTARKKGSTVPSPLPIKSPELHVIVNTHLIGDKKEESAYK